MVKKKVVTKLVESPCLIAKGRVTCPKCEGNVKVMFQCVDCGTLNCQGCSILKDDRLCNGCSVMRDVSVKMLNDLRLEYQNYNIEEPAMVQGIPLKMLSREDLIQIYVAKEPKQ